MQALKRLEQNKPAVITQPQQTNRVTSNANKYWTEEKNLTWALKKTKDCS